MESRIQSIFIIFFASLMLLGSQSASAEAPEQVIEPEIERRAVTEDDIDSEDFEIGFYYGALSTEDFGVNDLFGLSAAYHINEDFFTEFSYAQSTTSKSSIEVVDEFVNLLTDDERELSFYNVSLGYNILPGEAFFYDRWAFNSVLYLIGGIGSTDFAGDERFTISLGVGYRLLINDWMAIHLDAKDHIFDIDVFGEEKTAHNLALHGGVSFFF